MPIDDDGLEIELDAYLPEDDQRDDPEDALAEDDDLDDEDDELDDEDDELDDEPADGHRAMVDHARRRYGTMGAVMAGGFLGLDKVLGRKAKEEAPVEWETPGEPLDIDRKGITVPLDDDAKVHSQPGPPKAAGAADRSVTKRRRP